jgi:hypothetical protein
MFFRSKRKVAAVSAIAAMRPLIALAQQAGGMSIDMWRDPYLLGYLSFVSSFFAKNEVGSKVKPMDLGFALQEAFSTVSNMNGAAISLESIELSENRDPEFERGMNDAITVTFHSLGLLRDEETNPLVLSCRPMGESYAKAMMSADVRSSVSGVMMQETFLKRVKEFHGVTNA